MLKENELEQFVTRAASFLQNKYSKDVDFRLTTSGIELSYGKNVMEFNLWCENNSFDNHHFYTFSNTGSYQDLSSIEGFGKDAMKCVKEFMEERVRLNGKEGYLIFTTVFDGNPDNVCLVERNLNELDITEMEKRLALFYFNGQNFDSINSDKALKSLIGGRLGEKLNSVLNARSSFTEIVLDAVKDNVLLNENSDREGTECLMWGGATFEYHGEVFSMFLNQDTGKVEVKLLLTGEEISFDSPFSEKVMTRFLESLRERNKLKNLIQPSRKHFDEFFKRRFNMTQAEDKNFEEEYEKLIAHYGEWEPVERIFRDASDKISRKELRIVQFMQYENPYDEKSSIKCYNIPYSAEEIFFITVHKSLDKENPYRDVFRIFIEKKGKSPMEFRDYLLDFTAKKIDNSLADLHF